MDSGVTLVVDALTGFVSLNCNFEIDDAEAEWTWDEGTFDYTHNRNFVCAIRDWPKPVRPYYQYGPFHCDMSVFSVQSVADGLMYADCQARWVGRMARETSLSSLR